MGAVSKTGTATLADVFAATAAARGTTPALLDAEGSVLLTWQDYAAAARRVAGGLAGLDVGRGDTIGLLLRNRAEFHVADAGALLAGATPFSMYNTSAPEQLAHLIADAGCRVVIIEAAFTDRLHAALQRASGVVEHVIAVDSPAWSALAGADELTRPNAVSPGDVATIIYTSGTTGPPKGVELTHTNILTMATEIAPLIAAQPQHRVLSYLPMAHIAERVCTHYLQMVVGYSVACCPEPGAIMQVLPQIEPEFFFSPPRLWEKAQTSIQAEVAAGADHADLRRRLGFGRLVTALTGAAPCPTGLIEFFASIGIGLREVYGLSETTGVVSLAPAHDVRVGSAGPPLPSAQVHVADDGELLVRGPLVMAGYRNRPEATAAAIDADGWLHTGDIGAFDADGQLRIVDRKKELIINAAGKNMSPVNIESRLKESGPLIGQACVIGNGRPFNVALIVVEPAAAAKYQTREELDGAVAADVAAANARLARIEQIKRFTVLTEEWLPDSDELTATLKLKRRAVERKYSAHIKALYTTKEKS